MMSFILEAARFTLENIQTTIVCPHCKEVFQKEFPLELEGLSTNFNCAVCKIPGEVDLPFKEAEKQEKFQEDLVEADEISLDEADAA